MTELVCVCICVLSVCMYVSVHVCTIICVYVCISACIYIFMSVHMCECNVMNRISGKINDLEHPRQSSRGLEDKLEC